jgi:hypothetical protein
MPLGDKVEGELIRSRLTRCGSLTQKKKTKPDARVLKPSIENSFFSKFRVFSNTFSKYTLEVIEWPFLKAMS